MDEELYKKLDIVRKHLIDLLGQHKSYQYRILTVCLDIIYDIMGLDPKKKYD